MVSSIKQNNFNNHQVSLQSFSHFEKIESLDLIAEFLSHLSISDIQNFLITSKKWNIKVLGAANLLIPLSVQNCFSRIFQTIDLKQYAKSCPFSSKCYSGNNPKTLQQINSDAIQPYCHELVDWLEIATPSGQNMMKTFLTKLRSTAKTSEFSSYAVLNLCSAMLKKTSDPEIKKLALNNIFEVLIDEGMVNEAFQIYCKYPQSLAPKSILKLCEVFPQKGDTEKSKQLFTLLQENYHSNISECLCTLCTSFVDNGDFTFAETILKYMNKPSITSLHEKQAINYYLDAKHSIFQAKIQEGADQDLTAAYGIAYELSCSTCDLFTHTSSNCMKELCNVYIRKGDMENAEKAANSCYYLRDQQEAYQALREVYVNENDVDKYLRINKLIKLYNEELHIIMINQATSFCSLEKLIPLNFEKKHFFVILNKIENLLDAPTDSSDFENLKKILFNQEISFGHFYKFYYSNNSNWSTRAYYRYQALNRIIPHLCELEEYKLAYEIISNYKNFEHYVPPIKTYSWNAECKDHYLKRIFESALTKGNFKAARKTARLMKPDQKRLCLEEIKKVSPNNNCCITS